MIGFLYEQQSLARLDQEFQLLTMDQAKEQTKKKVSKKETKFHFSQSQLEYN